MAHHVSADDADARCWAEELWPQIDWQDAEVRHGAFHLVVLPRVGPVLRITVGHGHATQMRREVGVLATFEQVGLSLPVPRLESEPLFDTERSGVLISRVPGRDGPDRDWDERLSRTYRSLLDELAAIDLVSVADLPQPRSWCGEGRWSDLIADELLGLLEASVRTAAVDVVAAVLDHGQDGEPRLCHGDFGPHNLSWTNGEVVGWIDLDHACVADLAVDLAPLVGFYGADAVESMAGGDHIDRAMIHRASLPLQVAAAAHLKGYISLRDHALANFTSRHRQGVSYDPGGRHPRL